MSIDKNLISSIWNVLKNSPSRRIITLISAVFAVALYNITVNNIAPTENVLSKLFDKNTEYTFYSGSEGGFYIKIGKKLEENFDQKKFKLKNIETNGGLDNVLNVISDANSFGLVQESTLADNDMLRQRVKFITPLYMERLHIVYNKKTLLKKDQEKILDDKFLNNIVLKKDNSSIIADIIKSSTISVGTVGSGTKIVSAYLFDVLDIDPSITRGLSQEEGYKSLKNGDIDIYINIVGAPIERIYKLVESGDYGLISIDPTIIAEINKSFNTNYRLSDFKNKYKGGEKVSTIGSYAYLIANNNVKINDINRVLLELKSLESEFKKTFKDSILSDFAFLKEIAKEYSSKKIYSKFLDSFKLVIDESLSYQLGEIDFASAIQKDKLRKKIENLRAFLLFTISMIVNTSLSIVFLVWTYSSIKLANYYKQITDIYQISFPKNCKLEHKQDSIFYMELDDDRKIRLNDLIEGINKTFNILTEVRVDYDTGGITDDHFENIKTNLKKSLSDFRKAIFRNLYVHLRDNKGKIDQKFLDSYLIESYIIYEDYAILNKMI